MPNNILQLEKVSLSRGGRQLFSNVDFVMAAGQGGLLLGPSGSGKSSLLALFKGELFPQSGRVIVDGREPRSLSPAALAGLRRQVATIYQGYNLVADYSVLDNVLLPAYFSGYPKPEAAAAVLEKVGLAGYGPRLAGALSGGEQQRVAIARALYCRSSIVLADEPTGNLDDRAAALVISALEQLAAAGTTLLIATHDSRLTAHFPTVLELCGT